MWHSLHAGFPKICGTCCSHAFAHTAIPTHHVLQQHASICTHGSANTVSIKADMWGRAMGTWSTTHKCGVLTTLFPSQDCSAMDCSYMWQLLNAGVILCLELAVYMHLQTLQSIHTLCCNKALGMPTRCRSEVPCGAIQWAHLAQHASGES